MLTCPTPQTINLPITEPMSCPPPPSPGTTVLSVSIAVARVQMTIPVTAQSAGKASVLEFSIHLKNATFVPAAAEVVLRGSQTWTVSFRNHGSTLHVTLGGSNPVAAAGGAIVLFPAAVLALDGLVTLLTTTTDVAVLGEMHHKVGSGTVTVASTKNPVGDSLPDNLACRSFALQSN